MSILITGGAGYIGSHTCVEMLSAGKEIVVVDNLDNSSKESLKRVEKITGKAVSFTRRMFAIKRLFAKYLKSIILRRLFTLQA